MTDARINPLSNLAFKKVLSSNSSKDVLAGLIHDFFGFTPEKITIKKPYTIKSYIEEFEKGVKKNVLRHTEKDIAAKLESTDFIAEAQVHKDLYFEKRAGYYAFDAYCDNYNGGLASSYARAARSAVRFADQIEDLGQKGNEGGKAGRKRTDGDESDLPKYASLRPVYSLNILRDSYYRDKHPLRIFELHDPVRNIRPEENPVYLAFFELKKDNGVSKEIEFWRQYFLTGEAPAGAPEYIGKAAEMIRVVNLNEEERAMMNRTERAIEFNKSMIMQEHLDWKNEGIEIGEQREKKRAEQREKRGKMETARQMKADGMEAALIRKYTGLPAKEIQKL